MAVAEGKGSRSCWKVQKGGVAGGVGRWRLFFFFFMGGGGGSQSRSRREVTKEGGNHCEGESKSSGGSGKGESPKVRGGDDCRVGWGESLGGSERGESLKVKNVAEGGESELS